MKKSLLAFVVSALVLVSCGLYLYFSFNGANVQLSLSFDDFLQFGVIILLVLFGLFVGIKRLKSEKRGEPTDDEFTKTLVRKASSLSYFLSLWLWVVLLYANGRWIFDAEVLIGYGILGMGLIFAITFLVLNKIGVKE